MNITQDPFPPEISVSEVQDEFASGPPNRMRLGAVRLAGWLFRPPYFPAGLTWLLMALIASNAAIEFLPQPASYWIDPGTSTFSSTFLGAQLEWGWWNAAILAGYMFLVGLLISLTNVRLAFVFWIGWSAYHFVSITESFRCGAFQFSFENPGNCGVLHSGVVILAGVLWGLFLSISVRLGLIPLIQSEGSEIASIDRWNRNLGRASVTWVLVCGLAVGATATFTPRPDWSTIKSAHVPAARTEASLAYDTQRSVAVLFGGTFKWTQERGWQSVDDTWEWDGQDWTQREPAHSPSPRYGAGMAFDEERGVAVLFGGMAQPSAQEKVSFDDTWEWDGHDWKEMSLSTRPPARHDQIMFFDPVRGNVVIYGGYHFDAVTRTDVFFDDAWEWDGETWQQIPFEETRRNSASAAVYDPFQQLPMLMDAEGLWIWQGPRWTQPNYPASPPGRWGSQLVYNPGSKTIILFGGSKDQKVFDDTWMYDGQNWQEVITEARPPQRSGHNMFYDPKRGNIIIFGGLDGGTLYNDMWELVQP